MAESEDLPSTYELLLYAVADTHFGVENRWFIASGHDRRHAARLAFQKLCEEFPSHRVILLLVASVHDPATGRFRDVIIESRGIAPLIDRKRLLRLTHHERPLIARATAPPRVPAPRPVPAPPPRRLALWLTAGGAVAAAAAVLAGLRG